MESRKIRVLVIGEAVTASHILRPLEIANQLVTDSRYKIYYSCDRTYKPKGLGHQIAFFHLNSITPELFQSRLKKGKPAYSKSELESYVEEELHLFERIKPDIVISDFRISLGVSTKKSSVFHVSLSNAQWSPMANLKKTVPEHPLVNYLGETIPTLMMNLFKKQIFSSHLKPTNEIRKTNGLKEFETIEELYTNGDVTLYMDTPELFNMTKIKSNHHFIGPVHCSGSKPLPSWWSNIPSGKPVIFISSGSSGDEKAILKILKCLSSMDVTVLLARANKIEKNKITYDNVFSENYLPGLETAKKADLIICNGGSGMVYLGLSQSTPLLCIPTLMDQCLVSNAVVSKGIGLKMRPSKLNDKHIRTAVNLLLTDPKFKNKATKFSELLLGLDPIESIKNIIQKHIKPKEKMGRLTKRLNQISLAPVGESKKENSHVEIKLATSKEELNDAYQLIYKQYLEKGYTSEDSGKRKISFWNTLPNSYTLIAKKDENVVGTLTLVKDSIAGLPMDELVKNKLDILRGHQRSLCEITGLAIDGALCEKNTVMKLFQFGIKLSMRKMKSTDYVITVNPRHRFFYKKILCFDVLGETCNYKKVENAPAVPLRLNLLTIQNYYYEKYNHLSGDKNLHDFFFINQQQELLIKLKNQLKIRDNKDTYKEFVEFFKNEASVIDNLQKFKSLWKESYRKFVTADSIENKNEKV